MKYHRCIRARIIEKLSWTMFQLFVGGPARTEANVYQKVSVGALRDSMGTLASTVSRLLVLLNACPGYFPLPHILAPFTVGGRDVQAPHEKAKYGAR